MSEATPANLKVRAPASKKAAAPAKPGAKSGTPPKINPKTAKVVVNWKTNSPMISCRFNRDGNFVFAGGEDNKIYRFQVATGKRTILVGHESWVRDFAFLQDGKTVVACDYAGRIVWWPMADSVPQSIRSVDAHEGWVRCIAISPDGNTLATGGNDNLVKLWDANTGKAIRQFKGHVRHVYSVFFHPTQNTLLTGDLMGNVKQWALATGKEMHAFDAKAMHKYDPTFRADYGGVRSIDLSPDGKQLAFAGLHKCTNAFAGINEPLVMRFDLQSRTKVQGHEAKLKALAWRAQFHKDDFLIGVAGGGSGGHLLFWSSSVKEIHRLKLPSMARDMDLHPDHNSIVTAHYDKHLRIVSMT
jgi:WD40 repeat protein